MPWIQVIERPAGFDARATSISDTEDTQGSHQVLTANRSNSDVDP
jgi:hypothetical protein